MQDKQPEKDSLPVKQLQSYDHGFEKIYALEDVDITTIRRYSKNEEGEASNHKIPKELTSKQLSFVEEFEEVSVEKQSNCNLKEILSFAIEDLDEKEKLNLLGSFGLLNNCERTSEYLERSISLSGIKRLEVQEKFSVIIETHLSPWLVARDKIASDFELKEHLELISNNPQESRKILRLFDETKLIGRTLFDSHFIEVCPKVFVFNQEVQEGFTKAVDKALSYYYKHRVSYGFCELVRYLLRELSLQWECYSECFVYKCISLSNMFLVHKDSLNKLIVNLR